MASSAPSSATDTAAPVRRGSFFNPSPSKELLDAIKSLAVLEVGKKPLGDYSLVKLVESKHIVVLSSSISRLEGQAVVLLPFRRDDTGKAIYVTTEWVNVKLQDYMFRVGKATACKKIELRSLNNTSRESSKSVDVQGGAPGTVPVELTGSKADDSKIVFEIKASFEFSVSDFAVDPSIVNDPLAQIFNLQNQLQARTEKAQQLQDRMQRPLSAPITPPATESLTATVRFDYSTLKNRSLAGSGAVGPYVKGSLSSADMTDRHMQFAMLLTFFSEEEVLAQSIQDTERAMETFKGEHGQKHEEMVQAVEDFAKHILGYESSWDSFRNTIRNFPRKPVPETRVALVGNEYAGKTTLWAQLPFAFSLDIPVQPSHVRNDLNAGTVRKSPESIFKADSPLSKLLKLTVWDKPGADEFVIDDHKDDLVVALVDASVFFQETGTSGEYGFTPNWLDSIQRIHGFQYADVVFLTKLDKVKFGSDADLSAQELLVRVNKTGDDRPFLKKMRKLADELKANSEFCGFMSRRAIVIEPLCTRLSCEDADVMTPQRRKDLTESAFRTLYVILGRIRVRAQARAEAQLAETE